MRGRICNKQQTEYFSAIKETYIELNKACTSLPYHIQRVTMLYIKSALTTAACFWQLEGYFAMESMENDGQSIEDMRKLYGSIYGFINNAVDSCKEHNNNLAILIENKLGAFLP